MYIESLYKDISDTIYTYDIGIHLYTWRRSVRQLPELELGLSLGGVAPTSSAGFRQLPVA